MELPQIKVTIRCHINVEINLQNGVHDNDILKNSKQNRKSVKEIVHDLEGILALES